MIDWPSDRVQPGGVLHLKRASYTKETENLLKVLMDEAKLSNLQRNEIHYHLRNGDALPRYTEDKDKPTSRGRCFTADFRRGEDTRRRSLDLIKLSGAYQMPEALLGPFREPAHVGKKRLQEKMSGIKGTPRTGRRKPKPERKDETEETSGPFQRIQQLLNEIRERADWLEDMEKLGQGYRHRQMIQNQIAEKLREIKRLEKIQHETDSARHLEAQLNKLKL